MIVSSSLGAALIPMLAGQFMEEYPLMLMYLTTTTIFCGSIMFIASIFIGEKIKTERKLLIE